MKSFLILSALLLIGCAGQLPVTKLYIPDFKNNVTGQYDIIDPATLSVAPGPDHPLEKVNDFVCMEPKEYIELKKWYLQLRKKDKNRWLSTYP